MLTSEHKLIQNVLLYTPSIDVFDLNISQNDGDTIRKNVYIDNEYFSNSTLDIWQTKGVPCADTEKFIKYKQFNIEFQLDFACFTNPHIDLYHYTFKRCV